MYGLPGSSRAGTAQAPNVAAPKPISWISIYCRHCCSIAPQGITFTILTARGLSAVQLRGRYDQL